MAWATPRTWTAGTIVGASDLNTEIRDNMNFNLNGKAADKIFRSGVADLSTTSTTFVDMDATNLIFTKNVTTGRVMLLAVFECSCASVAYFDWILDSTTRFSNLVYGVTRNNAVGIQVMVVSAMFTGLSVASHTFKLQWKVSAGTAFVYFTTYSIGLSAYILEV